MNRENLTENGMVSILEGTQQLQEQHPNSVLKVSNGPLKIGLTKLSTNMTNVCGIRMRYEQNVNKSTLHSLLVLNPECQIKILEENLKFLFQEESTYNYFQIKSNHLSLRTGSSDAIIGSENNAIELNTSLIPSTDPTVYDKGNRSEVLIVPNKRKGLGETFNSRFSDGKELLSVHASGISSDILKDTKIVKSKRVQCLASQRRPLKKPFFDRNGCEEYENSRKDSDNQYEFTVEQEKIVSFVCNTSPPSKQTDKSSSGTEYSDDQTVVSDHDSDGRSKLWTGCNGETETLSDSASNTFCGVNKANAILDKDYLPKLQQMTRSSKLLWHPPTSTNYEADNLKAKQLPYSTICTNVNATKPVSDFRVSSESVQRNMESSFSRETTLFRETSLRGCYNMENIVKCMIPHQAHVQQELKKVRESIFSAVRKQQSADDLLSDSILSILDICKSWLKLSSHLKGKEFIDVLESNGTSSSVLNDFLQWQCVSRVFIDKMIDTLQKITPNVTGSKVSSALNDLSSLTPTDVKSLVYSPGFLNMHSTASSTNTCRSENDLSLSKCEINTNKNWKQRRFFLDQPKQVMESKKTCRPNYNTSNTYGNCSQALSPYSSDMLYGQGDPPLSYNSESRFCPISHQFPVKNSFSGQGDVNVSPNSYGTLNFNVLNSYQPDKHSSSTCSSKNVKHLFKERCGTKSYQTPIGSNVRNDFPILSLPMNLHSQATTSNFSIVPPFYNSQMSYTASSNYQLNPSQLTVKQNPIQCTDSDIAEKCTKSSYMKPGSYNIPEKPIGFQKIINNNIPIDDSPVVGVPFLFSGAQGILSPKALSSVSATEKEVSIENDVIRSSEDKWKAAMTSAEIFRDNLISCKADSGPNLKLSDTVSLKTHFLLTDEFSQGSSSNDFKLSSESEELSSCDRTSPSMDVSFVEAKVKTSDWLMQSFNKAVLENEREVSNHKNYTNFNFDNDSEFEVKDVYRTNFMKESLATNNNEGIHNHHESSIMNSLGNNYFQYGTNEKVSLATPELSVTNVVDKKSESNDSTSVKGKKQNRNHNKTQDDQSISSLFENRSSLFRRKTKSIFKRAITKPISSKLEDILNCICSTEVSSLVEFNFKSEKEVSKMEIKVRCPLYLQSLRCKLANHSYDTLDQALSDFQKYFMDIRNRNKGDKQSIDVVGALEHRFLDLVEKHFGSCQASPTQDFGLRDLSSSHKPRKSKKILRRC